MTCAKFESVLGFHCSPVLLGIKPANLVSLVKDEDGASADTLLQYYRRRFAKHGVDILPLCELEGKLSGKKLVLFGSYDWGDGEWMRKWYERAKEAGADLLADEGLIANNTPQEDDLKACRELGAKLA